MIVIVETERLVLDYPVVQDKTRGLQALFRAWMARVYGSRACVDQKRIFSMAMVFEDSTIPPPEVVSILFPLNQEWLEVNHNI